MVIRVQFGAKFTRIEIANGNHVLSDVLLHDQELIGGEGAVILLLTADVEHLQLRVIGPPMLLISTMVTELNTTPGTGAHGGQGGDLDVFLPTISENQNSATL